MTDGKWTCSTDEDVWNCGEEFDTPEEALEYAQHVLGPDCNLEDGAHVYVGVQRQVELDELARRATDASTAIESMALWLCDNFGDEVSENALDVSKEAETDLDLRLEMTVRQWMSDHGIKPSVCHIDRVQSHVWRQCPQADPDGQCVLHADHEGEHEWP